MIQRSAIRTLAVLLAAIGVIWTASAQDKASGAEGKSAASAAARGEAQSGSSVSAEMVKGRLNPAVTKPGDEIALRLKEDAKSDGQVLLKKGSTIKGVVKNVHRAEKKSDAKANSSAQSMIELEWMTAGLSGAASQSLQLALQSVVYANPLHSHQQASEEGPVFMAPASASGAGRSSGGLGVGAVSGVIGGSTAVVGGAASPVGIVGASSTGTVMQTQAGPGRAAMAVPVSTETSTSLQNNFGVSGNGLFHVGSGQAISSGGTATSMDIFSHMSNDAVITSPSRDFEISSGAQMQLLVQSNSRK